MRSVPQEFLLQRGNFTVNGDWLNQTRCFIEFNTQFLKKNKFKQDIVDWSWVPASAEIINYVIGHGQSSLAVAFLLPPGCRCRLDVIRFATERRQLSGEENQFTRGSALPIRKRFHIIRNRNGLWRNHITLKRNQTISLCEFQQVLKQNLQFWYSHLECRALGNLLPTWWECGCICRHFLPRNCIRWPQTDH